MTGGQGMIPEPGALDVAITAARRGGEAIRPFIGIRPTATVKSSPSDLVTAVDREAEAAIRQAIYASFPQHAILGEEAGGPTDGQTEYLWIVDPLDGTNNFVQTLPFYAVSVALAYRGELVVGVIYDPIRDELFTARRGGGAFLNGKPIRVEPTASLSEAIVATRTPFDYEGARVENLAAYAECARCCRSMRNMGAAALELAWVAAGRLSAYWEMKLHPWDRAAGQLLVTEAGGQTSLPSGKPLPLLSRCGVVASNGPVHAELVTLIQSNT